MGPLCAVCRSGYYMDEQTTACIKCGDWSRPMTNTAIMLAVLAVSCVGLYRQQQQIRRAPRRERE